MQIQSFRDFPLNGEILKSVEELGFESLFPIQAQAIMPLLEGKDVIGQAQTGTGKTAAFGIPMIQRLNHDIRGVQGLILTPTRELAVQVAESMACFGKYARIKVLAVYGGESINKQIHALSNGVHIVVGTPGRIIDLMERQVLNLSSVRILVLDEADRMLDMGFIDDIRFILSKTSRDRQTSLFSATIDESVMRVCNNYMKNPQKILVSKDEIALTQMKQYYTIVAQHDKLDALLKIMHEEHVDKAIIFCRTRRDTSLTGRPTLPERFPSGGTARWLHAGAERPGNGRFPLGKAKLACGNRRCREGLRHRGHNAHNQLRRADGRAYLLPPHRKNRKKR